MNNMNHIKQDIINIIEKNRISSVEVADALGKSGVLEHHKPLNGGKFSVGEVQYIYGHSESNWPIHEQGKDLHEGGILYVDMFECANKAAFGDILCKYFLLYKSMKGIVVNGAMRDVHTLKKESYAVWCNAITPLGCSNKNVKATDAIIRKADQRRLELEGGIMVCDDSGCTIIKKSLITEQTKRNLEFVELQEDIWYYCLDTLKWSTYDVVCKKRYIKEKDILPDILRAKLEKLGISS